VPVSQVAPAAKLRLSPLQRALMAADGTLSTLIEAYTGDTLSIRKLEDPASGHQPTLLELGDGEDAQTRAVMISGARLGPVLHAVTTLVPCRLNHTVRESLGRTETAIGKLFRAHRYETFREVLDVRTEPALQLAALLGVNPDSQLLVRTYRIFGGGRPLMAITERFRYERFLEEPEGPAKPTR
jgi:chorismate-pyruvate lyase